MSDILAQLGTKVGTEISSLSSRLSAVEGNTGGPSDDVDSYSEITYNGDGNVGAVTTWATSSKALLVKTKTLTYQDGNLYQVLITDGSGETVMLQTLTYDSSGNLESVTKDYA